MNRSLYKKLHTGFCAYCDCRFYSICHKKKHSKVACKAYKEFVKHRRIKNNI